jgi:uncharacterized repeat protein (TIGR01451 family)
MNRLRCLALVLTLTLVLSGSALPGRAALPEPAPPAPPREELEQLPWLEPEATAAESQGDAAIGELASLDWSKLVFQSYRSGNWEIYIADGNGGNQARLTWDKESDIHPRLNRDCTRIVFSSKRTGNYEIFVINADGSGRTKLTSNAADDTNPAWSPDGARIAFQMYRDDQPEVYVINADGSGQTRLTWDGGYDGDPAWSPDGSKLAFTSNRTGGYRIWVMNADGSGQTQLSSQPYSENPVWSPDGSQIAYDSDGNGDGWQELWVMNADGSNQRQVYDPPESQTDAWAGSWSPDGRYVAFTRITLVYYHGNWYWVYAYLDAWDSVSGGAIRLSSQGTDWNPDWQRTEVGIPTSQMNALPAQSPGPFTVSWSGSDTGPSGIQSYDVQVREGAGTWSDWQMGTVMTSASYPGIGGRTYYFRCRARDSAGNVEAWPADYDAVTTVEALPPISMVKPLPAYSRGSAWISWGGGDPGGSGIQTYDVQYRGEAESWTDWLVGTTDTSAAFSGTSGQTYYFRSRAADNAQNVESWPPGDGDAHTTLYTWEVSGVVRDNTGAPVVGAVVTTTPGAMAVIPSDGEGAYAAYVVTSSDSYAVAWRKDRYGDLPATNFNSDQDAFVNVVLPPVDNIVHDGGFESGGLESNWVASDIVTPVVTDVVQHTGLYAAVLGQPIQLAPPVTLFGGEGYVWGLSLAADGNGVLHAMWLNVIQAGYSETRTAYYASRQNDGTWSAPQNVSNYTHQTTPSRIAVDRNGTVHTVWGGEGSPDIYYASRGSDGLWSERQRVFSSSDSNWVRTVQFVVGDTGTIDMVWNYYDSYPTSHIYYTHRMNNGAWLTPQKIFSGALPEESPQLAVDKTGGVHVVWQQEMPGTYSGYYDIYYTYRDHNGIWSEPQNICNTPGRPGYSPPDVPQLVVGADGVVHVAWLDDTPGNLDIYYVQRREDGTWSDIQNISDSPGTSTGPLLAVDNQGIPHIVWEDDTTGNVEIYYSKRGGDGAWADPSDISNIPYSPSFWVGLNLVVKNEAIHVVWTQQDESSYEFFIAYTRQDRTGNWTKPQYFARDWNGKFPLMIAGLNEEIHIAWEQEAQIGYIGPSLAEQSGDSTIAQTVTIPVTMSASNLSLLYQLSNANPVNGTRFGVKVDNGITATSFFSSATNTVEWSHRWFDLTPWTGQIITLSFSVHQTAGYPTAWAYLDEVTIGSASPDLWVNKDTIAALPGEQVVYRITYGNRGGAPAHSVRITDTLPAELILVDADPPPRWGSTLLWMWPWDVGGLPAQSGPHHIVVTATVAPTATMFSSFTNTVSIGSASPELETDNNTTHAAVFVGVRTYLPLVVKGYFD